MDEFDESVEDEAKVSGKFLPGTLYFMKETDFISGETFEYYKIGIVKGERDVFDREKDHKTGNPRHIASVKDIESPAVQILETYLHNALAKHRVSSGEWFYLPDDLLPQAIELAAEIREKLVANVDGLLLEAGKSKMNHAGVALGFSQDLQDLANAALRAEASAKQAVEKRKTIGQFLKDVAGEDESLNFLFKISSVDERRSFDTTSFSKAHKEIYEKYKTKESSSWSLNFLVKLENKPPSEELMLGNLSPIQLHEAYLDAWSEQANHAFEHALLEAQLIAAIGDAASVDGLVEWKESKRLAFDGVKFKAEHPDLAADFMKVTPAKVNKSPAEWASYKK
jgi:hypothetical protein